MRILYGYVILKYMKKISSLFSILVSISISIVSCFIFSTPADAACGWWTLWFWCPTPWQIEYCQGSNCTIGWWLVATQNAVGTTFTQKTISVFVTDVVKYFLSFVTLIAVIYVIYAWFQLMTGGWDEEKVKKARQIIIYVVVGIVLMWLAYWIVRLILDAIK